MPAPPALPPPPPLLRLGTLDRGDGLLGLQPCGPPRPGQRSPWFGPRAVPLTLAWLEPDTAPEALRPAHAQALRDTGLRPLPAEALQWRGPPQAPARALWSLPREADFGPWWAEQGPRLQAQGWRVAARPGFAHHAEPLQAWRLALQPLQGPGGLGAWLLSLGIEAGGQTLDLVPMLARLIRHDRRWLDAQALQAIGDDEPVRLLAPGGRVLALPAAPLKALCRALVDLLTALPGTRRLPEGPLRLAAWEQQRLAQLRRDLEAAWSLHPSARRDPRLVGEAGLRLLQQRVQALAAAAGPVAGASPEPEPEPAPSLPLPHASTPPALPPPPAGLGLVLRPYQRQGLAWLQALAAQGLAGILADEMGLGKTAQALAHVLAEREAGRLDRPALVVCPASLLDNWRSEAARITPGLRACVVQGPRRAAQWREAAAHELVITSYPLLLRDALALRAIAWHLVILDEAQFVKNAGSRTAAAARRLDARHRLSLTGTPLENHLGELWAQFHFLLPGFLGDAQQFQRRWRTPIERNGETLRAQLLAARVRPFILRRCKDEVATELPPLTEQTVALSATDAQRQRYEALRLACAREVREAVDRLGWTGARLSVLDALLKLRQLCCDPRLLAGGDTAGAPVTTQATQATQATEAAEPIEPTQAPALPAPGHSAKLDWLREQLPALVAQGRRVLVFSQFARWLALLEPEMQALGLPWLTLTGAVPTAQRFERVRRFQAGQAPVLLASLKAGGTGLNLTAADTVLLLDPWWNPAVDAQAAARAHRIGQARPVWVGRLVIAGSIETRMLALQQRKSQLAQALLAGSDAQVLAAAHAAAADPRAALPAPGPATGWATAPWSRDDLDTLLAPLAPEDGA